MLMLIFQKCFTNFVKDALQCQARVIGTQDTFAENVLTFSWNCHCSESN